MCVFCVINEMCRRVGVPIYPDDVMIGPKVPTNTSTIRRLKHNRPIEVAQHDQEENLAGNDEEF